MIPDLPDPVWSKYLSPLLGATGIEFHAQIREAASNFDVRMLEFFQALTGGHFLLEVGRKIVQSAISAGNISTVRWMVAQGYRMDSNLIGCAASNGQFAALRYLYEIGCPTINRFASLGAFSRGHWRCLEFILSNREFNLHPDFYTNEFLHRDMPDNIRALIVRRGLEYANRGRNRGRQHRHRQQP